MGGYLSSNRSSESAAAASKPPESADDVQKPPEPRRSKSGTTPASGRCAGLVIDNEGSIEDVYDLHTKRLGEGAFAYVVKATVKKTGLVRAVKVNSKAHLKDIAKFKQEIDLMKSLDHPNILNLFEAFEDKRNIYLVMELCTGGELFDKIISMGSFTEVQAAVLMQQLLRAIFYMHSNCIAHRDLKPENFLFADQEPMENSTLKLIDFGLASRFEPGAALMKTKAGTPYYVAPQVLQGSYTEACDVWSAGVIMYILLCGYAPFDGNSDQETLNKVKRGHFTFPKEEWDSVSDGAKALIKKMLTMKPEDRITADAALHDAWVSNKAPSASSSKETAAPADLLDRFRGFQAKNKLVKTALRMIAWRMDDGEIRTLRETFVALDANGDGILTVSELKEGLEKAGLREIPPDLQALMEGVDEDGSGAIDYTEFIAAMLKRKTYVQEDMCWAAFRVFDKNGDGKITASEISAVLSSGSIEDAMGKEAVENMMKEVDTNGDGEIDFEEFMAMMRSGR
mmetsp:Transcript_41600/g.75428  ORF Transcript_41600/g.75428 Transcript_41600/m.75428 type:complete len:511 (-) Transcript_41600:78-1610(-)